LCAWHVGVLTLGRSNANEQVVDNTYHYVTIKRQMPCVTVLQEEDIK